MGAGFRVVSGRWPLIAFQIPVVDCGLHAGEQGIENVAEAAASAVIHTTDTAGECCFAGAPQRVDCDRLRDRDLERDPDCSATPNVGPIGGEPWTL